MASETTDPTRGTGETERLHSAACRAQEAQRRKEADAMQAGYELGLSKGIVDGYDATFWRDSYALLRDAVMAHLDSCIREDDVAEEAILVEAIETAGKRLNSHEALLAALRGVQSTSRHDCWCDGSHDVAVNGHQPKCRAAKEALARVTRREVSEVKK